MKSLLRRIWENISTFSKESSTSTGAVKESLPDVTQNISPGSVTTAEKPNNSSLVKAFGFSNDSPLVPPTGKVCHQLSLAAHCSKTHVRISDENSIVDCGCSVISTSEQSDAESTESKFRMVIGNSRRRSKKKGKFKNLSDCKEAQHLELKSLHREKAPLEGNSPSRALNEHLSITARNGYLLSNLTINNSQSINEEEILGKNNINGTKFRDANKTDEIMLGDEPRSGYQQHHKSKIPPKLKKCRPESQKATIGSQNQEVELTAVLNAIKHEEDMKSKPNKAPGRIQNSKDKLASHSNQKLLKPEEETQTCEDRTGGTIQGTDEPFSQDPNETKRDQNNLRKDNLPHQDFQDIHIPEKEDPSTFVPGDLDQSTENKLIKGSGSKNGRLFAKESSKSTTDRLCWHIQGEAPLGRAASSSDQAYPKKDQNHIKFSTSSLHKDLSTVTPFNSKSVQEILCKSQKTLDDVSDQVNSTASTVSKTNPSNMKSKIMPSAARHSREAASSCWDLRRSGLSEVDQFNELHTPMIRMSSHKTTSADKNCTAVSQTPLDTNRNTHDSQKFSSTTGRSVSASISSPSRNMEGSVTHCSRNKSVKGLVENFEGSCDSLINDAKGENEVTLRPQEKQPISPKKISALLSSRPQDKLQTKSILNGQQSSFACQDEIKEADQNSHESVNSNSFHSNVWKTLMPKIANQNKVFPYSSTSTTSASNLSKIEKFNAKTIENCDAKGSCGLNSSWLKIVSDNSLVDPVNGTKLSDERSELKGFNDAAKPRGDGSIKLDQSYTKDKLLSFNNSNTESVECGQAISVVDETPPINQNNDISGKTRFHPLDSSDKLASSRRSHPFLKSSPEAQSRDVCRTQNAKSSATCSTVELPTSCQPGTTAIAQTHPVLKTAEQTPMDKENTLIPTTQGCTNSTLECLERTKARSIPTKQASQSDLLSAVASNGTARPKRFPLKYYRMILNKKCMIESTKVEHFTLADYVNFILRMKLDMCEVEENSVMQCEYLERVKNESTVPDQCHRTVATYISGYVTYLLQHFLKYSHLLQKEDNFYLDKVLDMAILQGIRFFDDMLGRPAPKIDEIYEDIVIIELDDQPDVTALDEELFFVNHRSVLCAKLFADSEIDVFSIKEPVAKRKPKYKSQSSKVQ